MAEIIKEIVTTKESPVDPAVKTQTQGNATNYQTIEYIIYFLFSALEVFLVFRLILKLTGAGVSSTFVNLIYNITGIFILPFEGIFNRGFAKGAETTSVFEPSTVVALVVYAVLAVGIVKLVRILSGKQQAE